MKFWFLEQTSDCHFLFEWLSPEACPKEKVDTSIDDCMFKDPSGSGIGNIDLKSKIPNIDIVPVSFR